MLSILLRILYFLSALFLLNRFFRLLFGRVSRKQAPRPGPEVRPTAMVKDPICGMYLDPRLAVHADHNREAYYFCSDECRQKFLGKWGQA